MKQVLPKEKFVPVSEKIIDLTDKKEILDIPERVMPFKSLMHTMSKKLHQGEPDKLRALQHMNAKN